MEKRVIEIIFLALGSGVVFTLIWNFIFEVVPDRIIGKYLDWKPMNCPICFSGWLGLITGLFSYGLNLDAVAFAGLCVLATNYTIKQIF